MRDSNSRSSKVTIPRGEHSSALSEAGLQGKVEFGSTMSEEEVRREICCVFVKAMEYDPDADLELFPFDYLQTTGQGSKRL